MSCAPHCVCQCGHTGCECWDGIKIEKREEVDKIWADSENEET